VAVVAVVAVLLVVTVFVVVAVFGVSGGLVVVDDNTLETANAADHFVGLHGPHVVRGVIRVAVALGGNALGELQGLYIYRRRGQQPIGRQFVDRVHALGVGLGNGLGV
jgi:hypothetical protein